MLGVSVNTIGRWEGGRVPPERFRKRIAEELGVEEPILFDVVPKEFNTLLKTKRLERKLTQKELGERLGYSEATISIWEMVAEFQSLLSKTSAHFLELRYKKRASTRLTPHSNKSLTLLYHEEEFVCK